MIAPSQSTVAIVGAGQVGLALARMLVSAGTYHVRVGDCTAEALARATEHSLVAHHLDATSPIQLSSFIAGADVVVAAVPDRIVRRVEAAAIEAGCRYLDFSMPPADEPAPASVNIARGCGISPGLADLVVQTLAAQTSGPVDIALSVGAIPARRTNRLGYSIIWNFDGLFAEYTRPCEAIIDFDLVTLDPLTCLKQLEIDGNAYEAFCTSGVVAPMARLAGGNIRTLVCRTIRYPGHLDYMQFLLEDLRLRQRRDMLASLLQNGLASDDDDVVLMHACANRDDSTTREITIQINASDEFGSALAAGSAAHAAWLIETLASGSVPSPSTSPDGLKLFLNSQFATKIGIRSVEG